jgi:hypothetical protein
LTESAFDRGAIYEFIYRARDPIVMGIGFAAIRDIISFLRHGTRDNPLAPQERPRIRYALGFGISQSGRVTKPIRLHQVWQPAPVDAHQIVGVGPFLPLAQAAPATASE